MISSQKWLHRKINIQVYTYFLAIPIFLSLNIPESGAQSQSRIEPIEFRHLTVEQGLSNSWVRCILKDSRGFMWFGTSNGLNRYDGVEMDVFKREINNSESLGSNTINSLCEDNAGDIWIGTQFGINIFDRKTEKFHLYKGNKSLADSLDGIAIARIVKDREGNMWIGSSEGVYVYMEKDHTFKHFYNKKDDANSLIHNLVYDMELDASGTVWVATREGTDRFDNIKNRFIHYRDTVAANTFSMNISMSLHKDSKGTLWLGARDGGLYRLNNIQNRFERVTYDSTIVLGDRQANILNMTDDDAGKLYVGTHNGLYISDSRKKHFTRYASDQNSNIYGNSIQSVLFDFQNKIFWVGTENGGVNYMSKWSNAFRHYGAGEGLLSHKTVFSIGEDNDGNIWVTTFGGGVNVINKKTGKIKQYLHIPADPHSLAGNEATTVQTDNAGNVWVGTFAHGLDLYDKKGDAFIHVPRDLSDSTTLQASNIYDIELDRKGIMWLGTDTDKGLSCYHADTQTFSSFRHIKVDYENERNNFVRKIVVAGEDSLFLLTLSSVQIFNTRTHTFSRFIEGLEKQLENIQCILLDKRRNVWIGSNNGLFWIRKDGKQHMSFFEKDGLPTSDIAAILEDEEGNLWISSKTNGLFKFENAVYTPTDVRVITYSTIDGLQGNEFVSRSAYKGKDGKLYFGGQNGLNVFDPNDILINRQPPPVVLTALKIFNKEVPIGKNSPLQDAITETKVVTLSHKDYVFSLSFAALNFLSPEKNQYAYILENFEKEWNYVNNANTATYTNLSPGKYTFRVKASNNYGVWNEEGTRLIIIIKPPYWQEWWFRALVSLFVITSLLTWYLKRTADQRRQKVILEEKVKLRTNELQAANTLLTQQKEVLKTQGEKIERLYTDVKDSIRAAEVIQTSMLPAESVIKSYLPNSFIFNKPKDVVSGDFYWIEKADRKIVIALGDCTGHGVSGALMSINAYHLLNETYQTTPAINASAMLTQFNQLFLKKIIKSNGTEENIHGLDIGICVVDLHNNVVEFAGANSRAYVIRNGELSEIKGNPFAIGYTINGSIEFADSQLSLQKDDLVYLFSDGYADQFGGEDGSQKLKYNRFRQLLMEASSKDMQSQAAHINQFLDDWRMTNEQTDDILIIGFKV